MSRIKSLVENYSKVCRFCLQSNSQDLGNLYEQIAGKNDIVTINTTVRSVLAVLGIQITQNDVYPNIICGTCRSLLHSIQSFRETAQKSIQLLDQARLLKEFPNAKFDEEPVEEAAEGVAATVKEHVDIQESSSLDVAYEVMIASNEEDDGSVAAETAVRSEDEDEVKVEVEVEEIEPEIAASEYAETEWVVDDECEQEKQDNQEQEEPSESEKFYVEYIQEGWPDGDRVSATSEVTQFLHEEEMKDEDEESEKVSTDPTKTSPNKYCPICGVTSTAMAVHIRSHTKIRPFTCEMCEKKFYTSAKLRAHVESVHIGERKFSCEICGKAFVLRKTLNAHMMSHAAEKAFVCPVCSKGFLFRWALAKHERVHTGERPYVCNLDGCGKRFATSSNLSQHQKTNTHWKNPREDICECGKTFQNKYALRAHQRSHHGTKIVVGNSE